MLGQRSWRRPSCLPHQAWPSTWGRRAALLPPPALLGSRHHPSLPGDCSGPVSASILTPFQIPLSHQNHPLNVQGDYLGLLLKALGGCPCGHCHRAHRSDRAHRSGSARLPLLRLTPFVTLGSSLVASRPPRGLAPAVPGAWVLAPPDASLAHSHTCAQCLPGQHTCTPAPCPAFSSQHTGSNFHVTKRCVTEHSSRCFVLSVRGACGEGP